MDLDSFSDCRSGGSSMNSSRTLGSEDLDWQAFQSQLLHPLRPRTKALSFADLVNGRCTIEDVMQEFRMNGSDAPYNPEDDHIWTRSSEVSPGSHAANSYMRQKSWPAPERSPPQRLPRPLSASFAMPTAGAAATFNEEISAGLRAVNSSRMSSSFAMPATPAAFNEGNIQECERWADPRALAEAFVNKPSSLPQECRFCKNNGERISYYRSHVLRDAAGRVACPVLRALVCPRCGARGDDAHTLKYCPRSTSEERTKSAAMMRSVRMASGRRRVPGGANAGGVGAWGASAGAWGANGSGVGAWGAGSAHLEPLSPLWTALEQKLMLSLS